MLGLSPADEDLMKTAIEESKKEKKSMEGTKIPDFVGGGGRGGEERYCERLGGNSNMQYSIKM